ncbi:hypothetical protein B0H94_11025 [Salsuginibacillus halophilus]|uniref:Uncharacterized protein n=1 Tax=Salsuginibacillus halophilus TaxID=517424 RepID=A0A2P8HBF3_9BACI|nr:hypothetical protein B0H94_11025 [Salsuginibacillus halophilus]
MYSEEKLQQNETMISRNKNNGANRKLLPVIG